MVEHTGSPSSAFFPLPSPSPTPTPTILSREPSTSEAPPCGSSSARSVPVCNDRRNATHHIGSCQAVPTPAFDRYAEAAPWATRRYPMSILGLHHEIIDFYHWMRPQTVEIKIRDSVFDRMRSVLTQHFALILPSSLQPTPIQVLKVGSLKTKLFLPKSDIDILVQCNWFEGSPTSPYVEAAKALRESGLVESVAVYDKAYVPIVKVVDKDTGITVDISFNTEQGVSAADLIQKIRTEFPVMEPLIFLLKQFLAHRHLHETFRGGLSSYGLILMLHNFLKLEAWHCRGLRLDDPYVNLGVLLIRFLEVYSQEFNYMNVGVQVAKSCYKVKPKGDGDVPTMLCIEDPLLATNEVGRSSRDILRVRQAFEQALVVLSTVFARQVSPRREQHYSGSMLVALVPISQMLFVASPSLSTPSSSATAGSSSESFTTSTASKDERRRPLSVETKDIVVSSSRPLRTTLFVCGTPIDPITRESMHKPGVFKDKSANGTSLYPLYVNHRSASGDGRTSTSPPMLSPPVLTSLSMEKTPALQIISPIADELKQAVKARANGHVKTNGNVKMELQLKPKNVKEENGVQADDGEDADDERTTEDPHLVGPSDERHCQNYEKPWRRNGKTETSPPAPVNEKERGYQKRRQSSRSSQSSQCSSDVANNNRVINGTSDGHRRHNATKGSRRSNNGKVIKANS